MAQTGTKTLELLLVDDDAELRSDMASYFAHQGYSVEQSESGEAALDLLERRSFDVIVLDMMMPGMMGMPARQGQGVAGVASAACASATDPSWPGQPRTKSRQCRAGSGGDSQ